MGGSVGPMLLLKMPTFTGWMVSLRIWGFAQSGSFLSNMGSRAPEKMVLEHGLESYQLVTGFQGSGFEELGLGPQLSPVVSGVLGWRSPGATFPLSPLGGWSGVI